MKIALPSRGREVDSHFGHCEHFTVFTVDASRTITSAETFTPPPGCGCKSNVAAELRQMGVGVLLAGNMGEGAARHLAAQGIEVVRGCSGGVREAAERYLAGTLQTSAGSCGHGDHQGCGHH